MPEFTNAADWQEYVEGRVLAVLYHARLSLDSPWNEIEERLSRCAAPVLCVETARRLLEEKEKCSER